MRDIRPLTQRRSRQLHAQTWGLKKKVKKKVKKGGGETGGSKLSEDAGRARIDGDRGLCFCLCFFGGVFFFGECRRTPYRLLLHALVTWWIHIQDEYISSMCTRTSADVSIRQHTSACVSIREHVSTLQMYNTSNVCTHTYFICVSVNALLRLY